MDAMKASRSKNRVSTDASGDKPSRVVSRGILGSDMPVWIMLVLVGLALPRTVLTDIGVIEPDGPLIYYVLALAPYAVWLTVAVLRRTPTPLRDHALVGTLYGLSLVLVHEIFWNVESSQGHNPPQEAIDLASGFDAPIQDLVIHGYEFVVAMMIGVGSGIVMAIIAFAANRIRLVRAR